MILFKNLVLGLGALKVDLTELAASHLFFSDQNLTSWAKALVGRKQSISHC